jgi:hypothetical protein
VNKFVFWSFIFVCLLFLKGKFLLQLCIEKIPIAMQLHESQWKNGICIMEFNNMDAFLRIQPFCNAGICSSLYTLCTHICMFLKYATRQSFKCMKFIKCHEKYSGTNKVIFRYRYLYLLEGKPVYPCLMNGGHAISLPPITNSDSTKVSPIPIIIII